MGTPEFAVPALRALLGQAEVVAVYSQPDRPVGRGMKTKASPVKEVALQAGVPVFTPEKVSIPEEIERIRSFGADFIVVVAYGQILRLPVIDSPRFGTINIHSSLLPRWRGAAPIQRAILSGDTVTGITTMKIVPKLDAGDILLQEQTEIRPDDTAETLHDRLSELGAKLIVPTLKGIMENTLSGMPQDEALVTYAHKLQKEMEFVDWKRSAREIDLAVRALNPWPGIRIETKSGLSVKIKKGRVVNYTPGRPGPAGTLHTFGGELFLQCGQGAYQILELQEEGKRPVAGQDFLNGLQGRGIELPLTLKEGIGS
ncbi:MAG: methionyl-tRNA formyltransferase [Bdellovibrionales bacterium]|nr:methionyl-tRNA formyltransferase [Bdellovibrionales bacterium]